MEVMDTRSILASSFHKLVRTTIQLQLQAIWILIRHSTTVSFVKRSSITLSPLAISFVALQTQELQVFVTLHGCYISAINDIL